MCHGVRARFRTPEGKTSGEDELIDTNYKSYEKVPHHERQCKWPIYRSIVFCETRQKTTTLKELKTGMFNLLLRGTRGPQSSA